MCASELGHYGSGYGLCPFRWLAIACTNTDLISHPGLGWHNAFSSFPPQSLWLLITKPFILNLRYLGQMGCSSGYWVGGILDSPCLSVRLSVCPLTFRVRPVASTVQDGFFPYLVQMINSMRMCVAWYDLWPWPISSRSFGLDLENRVRSVASTVLGGFFLFLARMITIIRGCVAYNCFQNLEIWIVGKFLKFFGLELEKKLQFSNDSFHI